MRLCVIYAIAVSVNYSIIFIIMSSDNKDEIISSIYYDRSGYGSVNTTYQDAKKEDKTITVNDVKKWFEKNVEKKKQLSGYNSFVAPYAKYEYEIDLFFITKNDLLNQKFRVGMIMIDVFSKFMAVMAIKSKEPPDVLAGIMEGIQKMGGRPQRFYSDEEGSLNSGVVKEYLDKENIEIHLTRGHPNFAERGIRTFKDKLFKRVEADEKRGKENIQRTDYIFESVLTYNNKDKHSATGMTPKEGAMKKNEFKVKTSIELQSVSKGKYPELSVGSRVKIYRKKDKLDKQRVSVWLPTAHTIKDIKSSMGQKFFYLEDKSKPYLRHEILNV